jgi:hypothetical protein
MKYSETNDAVKIGDYVRMYYKNLNGLAIIGKIVNGKIVNNAHDAYDSIIPDSLVAEVLQTTSDILRYAKYVTLNDTMVKLSNEELMQFLMEQ